MSFTRGNSSPHLGTPDTRGDNNKSLALVPISTKDASPANNSVYGRSPLGSLGTNTNNVALGLRQRTARSQHPPSPFFNGDTIKGPPRASLTLSMAGSHSNGMVGGMRTPSVKNDISTQLIDLPCWVHVYGFSNQNQSNEVLRRFRAMGTVMEVKMAGGNQNWVALKYDNMLHCEKAASLKVFQLSDGCFCGVRKLPDAHRFFMEQQQNYSTVLSHNLDGNNPPKSDNLFIQSSDTNPEDETIDESDILLGNADNGPESRRKSCCESIFAWIYGWD